MFYTAESVTSGHPDKICDQISDAILDEYLRQDPMSRVAMETFGAHGLLVIGGEVTSNGKINAEEIARKVYRDIGHKDELDIKTNIVTQSPDIAQGVNTGGAGDQGIMYGYATDETPEYLPKAVTLAHKLTSGLENLRRNNPEFSWIRPDGKAQVTINYNNDYDYDYDYDDDYDDDSGDDKSSGKVETVLISTQHDEKITNDEMKRLLTEHLIKPSVNDSDYEILVNPTGKFVVGGFYADSGLTGRKIMVDTYGGLIPHGGGAFSGKDPTKVDRSAAYMARWAAKNVVANGLAKKCLVSVAYAIGRAEPLMVEVETFGAGNQQKTRELILKNFDFRPLKIIEQLNLRRPIYFQTASYGHFGKPNLPWEQLIKL